MAGWKAMTLQEIAASIAELQANERVQKAMRDKGVEE